MPANLTPEYLAAEEAFRQAKTIEEKIAALERMLATIPRHKGTDKLYGQLKAKLSKLRQEQTRRSATARRSPDYQVEREGAGQIVILGAPNAGKSSILRAVTKATPEVTTYPFATRKVVPGTMRYEDVRIQLIDTPSIAPEFFDPLMVTLVRNADRALVVVDITADEVLDQPKWVIDALSERKIKLVDARKEYPKFDGPLRLLPALIVVNKMDWEDATELLEFFKEEWEDKFPILPISVNLPETLERFKEEVFKSLRVVRVYSKSPGKKPDMDEPFILPEGASVLDFAEKVHRDFRNRFSYARVWGQTGVGGRRVSRDYIVQDRDIIELHLA